MAERYWENNTARRHIYIDSDTGRIIGTLVLRLVERTFEAHAYDQNLGEFKRVEMARGAVESACVKIEALRAAAAAKSQADGEHE